MSGLSSTRRAALLGGGGALAGLALSPLRAIAAPPPGFDAFVAKVMRTFDQPGLAIAIVEGDRTVLAKGYGVRKLGSPDPVDADTLFNIASNTKAFTAAALAVLVDEKKLGWDDPVIQHLPQFQMWDPYVTREMTVRDLLVHRSGLGLGAGDLLFWPRTNFTRAEVVERLRYIKPTTSFRSRYAYDNVLYSVAGEVIAAVSGMPYERFVAERLLKPLGMTGSVPAESWLKDEANRSWPHARTRGAVRGLGPMQPIERFPDNDNHSPGGGILSNARDMARWLTVQVNRGALPNGGRLFSEVQARQMWRGQTIIRASAEPSSGPAMPHFIDYALGWTLQDYRGGTYVWHSGSNAGQTSLMAVIPEKKVGFAVMTNAEEGMVLRTLMNTLLDHYLVLPKIDWLAMSVTEAKEEREQLEKDTAQQVTRPADAGPPSLPIEAYAGTYRDAWYGDIVIGKAPGGGLTIDFTRSPQLKGALEPWNHDTFRTRFTSGDVEDAFLTFALNPDGSIDQVKLQAVSPAADFSYDYQDLLLKPVS